jgi:hypothetical protein
MAGIQIDGVNNKIDFDDDADTSISSSTDDTLVIESGGATIASITAGEFAVNEGSADIDFRVESNGNTHALFVSGEQDHHVGIGTTNGITAPTLGETLQFGGYASSFLLDVNNASYKAVNLYYDGNWKKQTASGYGSIIAHHSAASIAFNVWAINNITGDAGTNVSSDLTERFKMDAAGNLTATDTTISALSSDERLKENIQDYSYDISKFKQFKPRSFDWKHPEAHDNQDTIGFVAQEVETIDNTLTLEIPWVDDSAHKGQKYDEEKALCNNESMKTSKLVKRDAMYISVIQQLITRIEALEDA